MHFSLSTLAAAAFIFAATDAAPHGRHSRLSESGFARPTGSLEQHRGGRNHTGGDFNRGPGGLFPIGSRPTGSRPSGALPTGSLPTDLSSIEFAFPSSVKGNINAAATSTKTKKSKTSQTKTSAAEATATDSTGDNVSTPASSTGASATDSSAAASEPSSTGTPASGNSTIGGGGAASSTFPTAAGESTLSAPMTVTGSFDGGMKRFGRGVSCTGQAEGGDSDAVFIIEEGGSLSNVIIGEDQIEGIHCMGSCTLTNVYWEAVCEDAFTIKEQADGATTKIIGGGAKGAEDKVMQHNGGGTLSISNFYVEDFGKLYRSCGNCKSMPERHVIIDGVTAVGGTATFVGINSNKGDTATITNSCIKDTKVICEEFEGTTPGNEPKEISSGPSSFCIYTDADISAC